MRAETVDAAQGGRHQERAESSLAALEKLGGQLDDYLYRWAPDAVARGGEDFVVDTACVLGDLPKRTNAEVAILYSLAVHHRLLRPGA